VTPSGRRTAAPADRPRAVPHGTGVGTLSWILFLPFSLFIGWLTREHGIGWAGWLLTSVTAVLAVLLVLSGRQKSTPAEAVEPVEADVADVPAGEYPPVPNEVACRELVHLVTDYLDGALPPEWRRGLDEHLTECHGCTEYLRQIRAVIDAVERLAADEQRRPVGERHQ